MMRSIVLALLAVTAAPSFAAGDDTAPAAYLTPADAIQRLDADPNGKVTGTFKLMVKAVGGAKGVIYLNSEQDYHDAGNVSVVLLPDSLDSMKRKFGTPDAMVGKTILVGGTAKRRKILFLENGKPTGKFYFQTQIAVMAARQIEFAP